MAAFREEATERKREQRRREAEGLRDVTQSDDPQSNQQLGATESPESKRLTGLREVASIWFAEFRG